jgi:molybdopterin-guanine dinucleotide biosynthesis protein A
LCPTLLAVEKVLKKLMQVACAILSGGKSSRMGRDKATMQVRDRTLIERTYEVARRIFDHIIIVSSVHDKIPGIEARVVKDALPVPGSLTGIVSGLIHSDLPYVFVLGCDMPFLTEESIRYVLGQNHGEHIIIPKTEAGFEPLHAIYNRCCISSMLSAVERGHMKVTRLLPFFSVRTVAPNPFFFNKGIPVFMNVNTREDLRLAEEALG